MDGCVYCGKEDRQLLYSEETDAYLHLECLKKELKKRPEDPEMRCLDREFAKLLPQ